MKMNVVDLTELDEKHYETLLKQYEKDDTLKVQQISISPGSCDGDNYMSIVKRLKITGKWKNNSDEYSTSIIVKRQIASKSRRELFRCDEAFQNEIIAYCRIIPRMRKFTNNNLPYPNCIYAGQDELGDAIVLEDLSLTNYKMMNRLKGLNFEQCSSVMEQLARLHSISISMKLINKKHFTSLRQQINEIIYCDEAKEFYTHSLESSLSEALSSLKKSNVHDDRLTIPIEKLEKLKGKLFDMMRGIIDGSQNDSDNDWNVICHGDIWINNIMLNSDDNKVKLIDLQTMRYTSPIIDILHFIYSSTERSLRQQYLHKLIAVYHKTLISTIKTFTTTTVDEKQINSIEQKFTIENLHNEFNSKSLYGLGICMWLLPAITFDPNNIPNLDNVQMEHFQTREQEKLMAEMQTPDYHRRMKDIVLEFYENGFLEQI